MESLHQLEVVILLLTVVLALTTIAQKINIPYPIFLVLGGLVLGMVPGLPPVTLHPDLVFLVFLPPILWAAAYFTSLREFRQNIRPISLLAVGLVLATSAGVAAVADAVLPGMGWAEAIALGAIVSPPDAVSATAIGKRLGIPRRVVTILEGESLVNDATALVLYRAAVGAVVSGSFALGWTLLDFLFAALVGVAIGIGLAWLTRWAICATEDGFTQSVSRCWRPILRGWWPSWCMRRQSWLVWRAVSISVSISAAPWPRPPEYKLARCGSCSSLF